MSHHGLSQIPVVKEGEVLVGMATMEYLMNRIISFKNKPEDPIEKALFKQFRKVAPDSTLGRTSRYINY